METKNKNARYTRKRGRKPAAEKKVMQKGKDEGVMDKRPGGNDPRWWGPLDFVQTVGRFNFSNPLGKKVNFSFLNDPNGNNTISMSTAATAIPTIPGVMAIDVLPVFGVCQYPVDPMNTYLRSFYSKLRSTNNQSAPYAAPDLGIYLLAIDSIHMGIEQLVRMYGIARTYSALNRYMPDAYLQAMGIDPKHANYNLYSNLADFRAEIINLMIKCSTLSIPKGLNFNERHRELVKYVYADGNTAKAQAYLFRTPYLYKFNATYNQSGGGLEATPVPAPGSPASSWITFVNSLIDILIGNQDFNIVSGDIQKSFGYDNLYYMPFLDEAYTVIPVYNPEILLEIHNAKVVGDRFDNTSFDIYQDAGINTLICHPYSGTTGATAVPVNCVIDVPLDTPDPDTVMIATRLACVGTYMYDSSASKFKCVPMTLGTEMVIGLHIYSYNAAGVLTSADTYTNVITPSTLGATTMTFSQIVGKVKQSYFDWHPHIYCELTSAAGNIEFLGIWSELSDYTLMEVADLIKLHEMALHGSLTVDGIDTVGLVKR